MTTQIEETVKAVSIGTTIGPYTLTQFLGAGAWKQTFEAQRADGTRWALKFYAPTEAARQTAISLGMTDETFWRKECRNGNNGSDYLASQMLETYGEHRFLAEELFDETLEDRLNKGRKYNETEILDIALHLAKGLAEFHTKFHVPHGDLKPANVGFSGRKVKIFDYGTATVHLLGRGAYTSYRAPETFEWLKENQRLGTFEREYRYTTDIWSYGAILYRLITGKELEHSSCNPNDRNIEIHRQLDENVKDKKLRALLYRCINAYESRRIRDGTELQEYVEDIIESKKLRYRALQFGKSAAKVLAGAVAGGLVVAGLLHSAYQTITNPEPPVNLQLPVVEGAFTLQDYAYIEGFSTADEETRKEILKRKEKRARQLPPVVFGLDWLVDDGYDVVLMAHGNDLSRFTGNHYIATLIAAYENALVKNHEMTASSISCCRNLSSQVMDYIVSDYQFAMAIPSPSETSGVHVLRETLARGMTVLQQPVYIDGQLRTYIDLEDLLTISVVGTTLMYQAREASGSKDFTVYIDAKRPTGEYIIPRKEAAFIQDWIGFAHQSAVPAQDFQPLVLNE